jgi:anion-transporting  ArsA/GET3 family ATPase
VAAVRHGQRVLAIELDAPGGLARSLGADVARPGQVVLAPSGVSTTWFDGAAALAEYLQRVVRLGAALDAVFAHPLYRAFVAAAPGLRELMAVGKIRDELLLQKDRWDIVVVDAGASGHAIEHLRMPLAAAGTFRSGRVHRESKRIHSLLSDPELTAVHVVATAEEMPIAEAAESVGRLRELQLPIGRLLVNQCRERPPPGVERLIARLDARPEGTTRDQLAITARRALGWIDIQERSIARLLRETGHEPLRLPHVVGDKAVSLLARRLGEVLS